MKQIVSLALLLVALNCLTLTQHADYTNILTLKFDYAAFQHKPLIDSSFVVNWNNKLVAEIVPANKWINAAKYQLVAKVGENVLNFAGTGSAAKVGAGLDNVELIRIGECGKEDVISNGDFREGHQKGVTVYEGGVKGWRATKSITVGLGKKINHRFFAGNLVTLLDPAADIYQSIVFDTDFTQISDDQI